jgi:transposase
VFDDHLNPPWKLLWHLLEDEFQCLLVNARDVKHVPGRKTDVPDAQWLCQLLECGLLKGSLVPPRPIRELRDLTRYRKSLIRERRREANRLHKLLEDAGIKLSCVASDTLGASGRAMVEALIRGEGDPDVLAELAQGRLRQKLPALRQALLGRFTGHRALLAAHILSHLDYLDVTIGALSTEIGQRLRPFEAKVSCSRRSPASAAARPRSSLPSSART